MLSARRSELALRRSKSNAVREFANRMVTDHNAAAAKFKQAVADAKLTPPAEKLDAEHRAILDALKAKNQPSFDRSYTETQYTAHVETVALFQAYANGGDNGRLKAFAADVRPSKAISTTSPRCVTPRTDRSRPEAPPCRPSIQAVQSVFASDIRGRGRSRSH